MSDTVDDMVGAQSPDDLAAMSPETYANPLVKNMIGGMATLPKRAIESANLYLSTILDTNRNDWTVWINGVAIGPSQDFQSFQITSIGPSYVELLVPLSAQGMRPVKLGPNQTFIAKSGAVIEGKVR